LNKALREVERTAATVSSKPNISKNRQTTRGSPSVSAICRKPKKGDADKISKRQAKLDEAQHELKTLESRDY
jgi:hypothetical protein